MEAGFRDFDQKVIAVDSSGGSRTVISELLKNSGFKNIQGMPGIKELIGLLEVEPASWILTSVFPSQLTNLMQLLLLINRVPSLRKIRVSAFVEASELPLLPAAFEHGLLSYHMKPFTRDSLDAEFQSLANEFKISEGNTTLVAATYLRKALNAIGNFQELLSFEQQLMKFQTGNVNQMLNIVHPLIKLNKNDEALALLSQILVIDPSLDKSVQAILAQQLNGASLPKIKPGKAPPPGINFLNLKSAVVVDNDSSVQAELTRVLKALGTETIRCFDDGKTALEALIEVKENDLIIQEWRIPRLTGPLFMQKAKDEASQTAPFIVYSSLIQPTDVPFVREMGVTTVIPKPSNHADLIKNIIWTIQQEHSPTEPATIERKIRKAIAKKDWFLVDILGARYLSIPSISAGARDLVQAEIAFGRGKVEEARNFALNSFKNAADSIFVLNLLGRIMTQLHELPMALKCYQKAQELAPHNLERLCQIAEIQAELHETEKSDDIQAKVLKMDASSERLKETRAKIAIKDGHVDVAKKILENIRSVENVISYMNNLAVSMARHGEVAEGIEQYKKTIRSLPVNRADLIAVVHYNLALAYIRANDYESALAELDLATFNPKSKVQKKALSLIKRLHAAKSQGITFQLQQDEPQAAPVFETNDKGEIVYSSGGGEPVKPIPEETLEIELRAGHNCCLGIYVSGFQVPALSTMMQGNIKFVARGVIHKF